MHTSRFAASFVIVALAAGLGCGEFNPDVIRGRASQDAGPSSEPDGGLPAVDGGGTPDNAAGAGLPDVAPVGPEMTGLHVVANRIMNGRGQAVVMHGVNRSGTEYKCAQAGECSRVPRTKGRFKRSPPGKLAPCGFL